MDLGDRHWRRTPWKGLIGLRETKFHRTAKDRHTTFLVPKMHEVHTAFQSNDHRRRPQPEEGPLEIIHEDDQILVLDKPAGIVVHPTYKNTSGTLLNAVLWRFKDRADVQPGILTRLDKGTSGVVVLGLTASAHATLQRDGLAGRTTKEYLAVVHGTPDPPIGRITLPLGRDGADRRLVVVRDDGAHAETHYAVIEQLPDERSLLRCTLVTGRTHQIRVHLAARGCPIVGDAVYGRADDSIARQALHAWKVSLVHPATRQRMEFEAPVPADMRTLMP
jgi:23S rRNA pseudouridine1911/1915/1917 synthase